MDIASNVTYKKETGEVFEGSKSKPGNKMSIPEYEVISQATRSIGYRLAGSNANSQLLPDFHGVREIEEREVLSNDKTSVEIANELTIDDSKKKRKYK